MKNCPYCAEQIQDAAITCKHCRRDLMPTSAGTPKRERVGIGRIILAAIIGVLGISFAIALTSDTPTTTTQIPIEQAQTFVNKAVQLGAIQQWTCVNNEAFVTPAFWSTLDADGRKGLAGSLARLCVAENSGDRMTLYDAQSGKRLASYSHGNFSVE